MVATTMRSVCPSWHRPPFYFQYNECLPLSACHDILCCCQVRVLRPSHKSTLQSKMIETPVPESVSAVHNVTNGTRDLESETDAGQEGRIREIVVDDVDVEVNFIAPIYWLFKALFWASFSIQVDNPKRLLGKFHK